MKNISVSNLILFINVIQNVRFLWDLSVNFRQLRYLQILPDTGSQLILPIDWLMTYNDAILG